MDLSSSSPRRPRSHRSNSIQSRAQDESRTDLKQQLGKLPTITAAGGSLRPAAPGHRLSRSVHHHNHHHLHLHGGEIQTRQRSQTYARPGVENRHVIPTDGTMERLKRVGTRVKDHSTSSHLSGRDRGDNGASDLATEEHQAARRARITARVSRQRKRAEARDGELRSVYQNISDISLESIQKLDDVYYSILERLSTLQSTIGGLQSLASQTKQSRIAFDEDAQAVAEDVNKQVVAMGSFSKTKDRIEQLETRIRDGRNRTEELTERLAIARERVQHLETQEAQVQASISFQFRIVWFILGGIATIIVALLLANYFIPIPGPNLIDGPLSSETHNMSIALGSTDVPQTTTSSVNIDGKDETHDANLISSLTDYLKKKTSSVGAVVADSMPKTYCASSAGQTDSCIPNRVSLEEDPRLKLFEEL